MQLTTAGSTKALQPPSSSNKARMNETAADPSRIITSWSLNCSKMSSQRGVGGSSGMAGAQLATLNSTITISQGDAQPRSSLTHNFFHACFGAQSLVYPSSRRDGRLESDAAPRRWERGRRSPWQRRRSGSRYSAAETWRSRGSTGSQPILPRGREGVLFLRNVHSSEG